MVKHTSVYSTLNKSVGKHEKRFIGVLGGLTQKMSRECVFRLMNALATWTTSADKVDMPFEL